MHDVNNHDDSDYEARNREPLRELAYLQASGLEGQQEDYSPDPMYLTLLGSDLSGRGNSPVREATMQSAQRTYGNKSVQRSWRGGGEPVPVQRGLWDDVKGLYNSATGVATDIVDAPATSPVGMLASMPIPGNPFALARAGHEANKLFGAGHDEKGNATPSLFDQGVNWAENAVSSTAHSLADKVSDVPVLGTVAQGGAKALDFTSQVSGGAWKAIGGMVGGLATMAEHPIDSAMGIEKIAETMGPPGFLNPLRQAHMAYDVISGERGLGDAANHWLNPIESMKQSQQFGENMLLGQQGPGGERHGGLIEGYRESWNQGKYGEILGRAGVDIGSFFIGGGEAGAAGKAGEVGAGLRAATEAGDVAKAMRGVGEANTALRGAEGAGEATNVLRGAGEALGEGKGLLKGGGVGDAGALGDVAHGPAPVAYEPHPFEVNPDAASGLKPIEPRPAELPLSGGAGDASGLELAEGPIQPSSVGGRPRDPRVLDPNAFEFDPNAPSGLRSMGPAEVPAFGPGKANIPPEALEMTAPGEQLNKVGEMFERGDLRRVSSDPALSDIWRRANAEVPSPLIGKEGYTKLRAEMGDIAPGLKGRDIHHGLYPKQQYPTLTRNPENLFLTDKPFHTGKGGIHTLMGVPSMPTKAMAWGNELGLFNMFDFMGPNAVKLGDVEGLLTKLEKASLLPGK